MIKERKNICHLYIFHNEQQIKIKSHENQLTNFEVQWQLKCCLRYSEVHSSSSHIQQRGDQLTIPNSFDWNCEELIVQEIIDKFHIYPKNTVIKSLTSMLENGHDLVLIVIWKTSPLTIFSPFCTRASALISDVQCQELNHNLLSQQKKGRATELRQYEGWLIFVFAYWEKLWCLDFSHNENQMTEHRLNNSLNYSWPVQLTWHCFPHCTISSVTM